MDLLRAIYELNRLTTAQVGEANSVTHVRYRPPSEKLHEKVDMNTLSR